MGNMTAMKDGLSSNQSGICWLAGEWIDDACLQSVYEAAGDPAICDRIYLQGVVPNCRAYYARLTHEIPEETVTLPGVTPANTVEEIPVLIPGLELGYDCSKVERLH
jgi:hypothetical protein